MSPTVSRFALANGIIPGICQGSRGRAVTDKHGAIVECKLPIDIRLVVWLGIDPTEKVFSQALR